MAKIKRANRNKIIYPLIITSIFMSIGYASINSITMNIAGNVSTKSQEEVFITDVKLLEGSGNVITYSETVLGTNTTLTDDVNSKVTYEITVYNSTDEDIPYFGEIYDKDENTLLYTNPNIDYELSISKGTIVPSNDDITFTITFKFKNNTIFDNKNLESYIQFIFVKDVYLFDYTGGEQEFLVPISGTYRIELWGAQGGGGYTLDENFYDGGKGGYVSGEIELNKDDNLYIYVGGKGTDGQKINYQKYLGGYNGGGDSYGKHYGGGGSTDVRLKSGVWDDFNSLKSRIMVAGGGGGSSADIEATGWSLGGAGGGLNGLDAESGRNFQAGLGATQTSGFAFGKAFSGDSIHNYAGGGSGYYGSSSSNGENTWDKAAGGGSSFISGHDGCDAIHTDSNIDNIMHTKQSIHYSEYQFSNTIMIDGKGCKWTNQLTNNCNGMPTYDGTSAMTGNSGNGYAKITLISTD